MMAALNNRADLLERKLEKHIRVHTDEIRHLKSELLSLKPRPKTHQAKKDQRPLNDATKVPITPTMSKLNDQKMSTKPLNGKYLMDDKGSAVQKNKNNFSGDKMVTRERERERKIFSCPWNADTLNAINFFIFHFFVLFPPHVS
jgi:hypothetical protein